MSNESGNAGVKLYSGVEAFLSRTEGQCSCKGYESDDDEGTVTDDFERCPRCCLQVDAGLYELSKMRWDRAKGDPVDEYASR